MLERELCCILSNMRLLIGLGNPGPEYEKNRHNVGFMFLDYIAEKMNAPKFELNRKYQAELCEVEIGSNGVKKGARAGKNTAEKVMLIKPQTYMNSSGVAIQRIAEFYKIPADNITIVHDDLDLAFGDFKIQHGKGPKVHNGVLSVENNIGSPDFWRVRIGVDNREADPRREAQKIEGRGYVLKDFPADELKKLKTDMFAKIWADKKLDYGQY